ncbi:muscular LMNA-interacting protein isoform X5 [Etheostoma cragini]|uniref:muscular LMNA-interacting protein isoform X5 n=1 Tax=Etheostoma cragini TaxID=417921 RepID=UPI00155F05C7|nr:muscular LMNA-interacting protein isoform X5 [Etheostoma cragini]
MDRVSKSLGEGSKGVPSHRIFTFMPVVQKLPIKNIVTEEERSGALTEKTNKNLTVSHEKTAGEIMSDGEILKAEIVLVKDYAEGGAGNTIQPGTKLQPSPDHVSLSQTEASPSVSVQSENTLNHVAAGTASMETAVDKHRGISQGQSHYTSGLTETHKIKLSYKSFAAIPTNTLLLDQQTIDEQVEREESPCYRLDRGVADTHAEMCSPTELRQQSEALYAVIDEILADSIPPSITSRSQQPSRSSTTNIDLKRFQSFLLYFQQNNSSSTQSLGRETKYASVCSLHPSTGVERKLLNPEKTKPGVIRPMTASPRLMVENEKEFHPNPFRQFVTKNPTDNKKVHSMSHEEASTDFYKMLREDWKPEHRGPFSVCDLQITEPEDQMSPSVKDASTSFSPTKRQTEAFETHI